MRGRAHPRHSSWQQWWCIHLAHGRSRWTSSWWPHWSSARIKLRAEGRLLGEHAGNGGAAHWGPNNVGGHASGGVAVLLLQLGLAHIPPLSQCDIDWLPTDHARICLRHSLCGLYKQCLELYSGLPLTSCKAADLSSHPMIWIQA